MDHSAFPFGWTNQCGFLVECPTEQQALIEAEALNRVGMAAQDIAETLAGKGWRVSPGRLVAGLRMLAKRDKPTLMDSWCYV